MSMKSLLEQTLSQEKEIERLTEALHEIYSKACVAINNDEDYLYYFARDEREIALKAKHGS
jgi:hypothetical protein